MSYTSALAGVRLVLFGPLGSAVDEVWSIQYVEQWAIWNYAINLYGVRHGVELSDIRTYNTNKKATVYLLA